MLFNHLATSFVPSNQPCVSPPNSSSDRRVVIPDGISLPKSKRDSADTGPVVEEPAIALVCPFEGGDAYVAKAVNEVAAHLSADVVRLDLSLGVGFDGHLAPLAVAGEVYTHLNADNRSYCTADSFFSQSLIPGPSSPAVRAVLRRGLQPRR